MHHPSYKFAKRPDRAVKQSQRSSQIIPVLLASALQHHRAGRLNQAEAIYRQILSMDAQHADSLHLLGMVVFHAGRYEDAVEMIRSAIAINEKGASYHSNLGTVLRAQGKLEEAAASYQRALALRPDLAEVHTNLGNVLRAQSKLEEAVACHELALAFKPELAEARYNLGMAQLQMGDFTPGWHNFESRWQSKDFLTPMRAYPKPLWTGEKLASGSLLIWGEQGVGDEIMFAGLIPNVVRTGNRCVLDCDPRLKPLFARSFPGLEVVSKDDSAPKHLPHDPELEITAHLPSGSLPALFRKTSSTFAAATSPYLFADRAERERFRACYAGAHRGKKRLVGLAWHSRNRSTGRHRSVDLSLFAALFALPGIRWVSLQYGDYRELESQAAAASAPLLIDGSVDQLSNIDRFAAQISALDMVITIDNSTAHLAGALGVPAFVLLPFASDWRWFQAREDSLWYPSLRLFRQSSCGDWQFVMQRVRSALNGKSHSHTKEFTEKG